MKLIQLFKRLLWKYRRPSDSIEKAISEGIEETFKEMGYDVGTKDIK